MRVELIEEPTEADVETEALMRALVGDFEHAAELGKPIPQEVLIAASAIEEPGRLADFVAFHLNLKVDEKQEILEALDPRDAPREGDALPEARSSRSSSSAPRSRTASRSR